MGRKRRNDPHAVDRTLVLLDRMERVGMTKSEMAKALGISPSAFNEYGKRDAEDRVTAMPIGHLAHAEREVARREILGNTVPIVRGQEWERGHYAHAILEDLVRVSRASGDRFDMIVQMLLTARDAERSKVQAGEVERS